MTQFTFLDVLWNLCMQLIFSRLCRRKMQTNSLPKTFRLCIGANDKRNNTTCAGTLLPFWPILHRRCSELHFGKRRMYKISSDIIRFGHYPVLKRCQVVLENGQNIYRFVFEWFYAKKSYFFPTKAGIKIRFFIAKKNATGDCFDKSSAWGLNPGPPEY